MLLDTQALLWGMFEPQKLSRTARVAVNDPSNEIFVSAVSPYELEWKKAIGKLRFSDVPDWDVAFRQAGYKELPLHVRHAQHAARLPKVHRDPWDRMLIAQAALEQLALITSDAKIASYGVRTLW